LQTDFFSVCALATEIMQEETATFGMKINSPNNYEDSSGQHLAGANIQRW